GLRYHQYSGRNAGYARAWQAVRIAGVALGHQESHASVKSEGLMMLLDEPDRPEASKLSASPSKTGKENRGMEQLFDLVIKNARVVRPNNTSVDRLDIAVKDEKVARLPPDIQAE